MNLQLQQSTAHDYRSQRGEMEILERNRQAEEREREAERKTERETNGKA